MNNQSKCNRTGFTLVEMVVTIAIVAIMAIVVDVSANAMPRIRTDIDFDTQVNRLRVQSARLKRTLIQTIRVSDTLFAVTATPDGRIVSDK